MSTDIHGNIHARDGKFDGHINTPAPADLLTAPVKSASEVRFDDIDDAAVVFAERRTEAAIAVLAELVKDNFDDAYDFSVHADTDDGFPFLTVYDKDGNALHTAGEDLEIDEAAMIWMSAIDLAPGDSFREPLAPAKLTQEQHLARVKRSADALVTAQREFVEDNARGLAAAITDQFPTAAEIHFTYVNGESPSIVDIVSADGEPLFEDTEEAIDEIDGLYEKLQDGYLVNFQDAYSFENDILEEETLPIDNYRLLISRWS